MKAFLAAILGGTVPLIAVSAAGILILNLLRIRRRSDEMFPLALVLGSPLCAALHFALFRAGATRRGHFYAFSAVLLAAALAFAYWQRRQRSPRSTNRFSNTAGKHSRTLVERGLPGPPMTPWSRLSSCLPVLLLAAIMSVSGWTYILAAAGPDTTPSPVDSSLAQAAAMLHLPHAVAPPSLTALLFLAPVRLGGPSAAAVFHLGCLFALALLCAAAARHVSSLWLDARSADWAYFAAGSLVFVSPALALAACDARMEIIGILGLAAGLYLATLAATGRAPSLAFAALLTIPLVPAAFTRSPAFSGFLFLPLSGAWFAIPLAAVAAAVLIAKYRAVLALAVAFHLATSWTGAARLLAPPGLALMEDMTWEEATIPDRDSYLASHLPGYIEARFLDESTHPGARIAFGTPLARAWTTRAVVPFDNWAPLLEASSGAAPRADRIETRRFSALTGRFLPVALSSPAAEIRLFHKGAEIARQSHWRVRCAEAFDNALLTLCAAAAAEIDFHAPVTVDEIRIHGFRGVAAFWPPGMRRAAIDEMKRAGITHIFLQDRHKLTNELYRNAQYWGLHEAGERAGAHLYALD